MATKTHKFRAAAATSRSADFQSNVGRRAPDRPLMRGEEALRARQGRANYRAGQEDSYHRSWNHNAADGPEDSETRRQRRRRQR